LVGVRDSNLRPHRPEQSAPPCRPQIIADFRCDRAQCPTFVHAIRFPSGSPWTRTSVPAISASAFEPRRRPPRLWRTCCTTGKKPTYAFSPTCIGQAKPMTPPNVFATASYPRPCAVVFPHRHTSLNARCGRGCLTKCADGSKTIPPPPVTCRAISAKLSGSAGKTPSWRYRYRRVAKRLS
jgi:hypothetical protein